MFANRAMAVARLISLHLSIPSSRTTPKLNNQRVIRLSSIHAKHSKVSFASDVKVVGSTPISTSQRGGGTEIACSESTESGVLASVCPE